MRAGTEQFQSKNCQPTNDAHRERTELRKTENRRVGVFVCAARPIIVRCNLCMSVIVLLRLCAYVSRYSLNGSAYVRRAFEQWKFHAHKYTDRIQIKSIN